MTQLSVYLSELVHSQLENRQPAPLPEDVTAEQIAAIAKKHHMERILLNPLVQLGLDKDGLFFAQITKSMYISANQVNAGKRISAALEKAGIVHQLLKGTVMKGMYPKPELRQMSDIDLLVKEEDFEKTDKALASEEFSYVRKEDHHDIYLNKTKVMVELHRCLYAAHVDVNQHDYFTSFKKTTPVKGCRYAMEFSKEDFYVYMVAHMARHFYARGCGIRYLMDIYIYRKLYEKEMNREYVKDELSKCGILSFEKHASELADIWLDGKPSNSFYDDLFEYLLDSGIYGKDSNGIWNKYMRMNNLSEGDSPKNIKRIYYFPPAECLKDDFPWVGKHHWLLPFAWTARAFRALTRKKSRSRQALVKEVSADEARSMQNIYKEMNLNFKKGK